MGISANIFPHFFVGFYPLNPFLPMELIYKQCVLSPKWLYVKDTLCDEAFRTIKVTHSAPGDMSF